ncbi:MAG TPA: IS110 family transposase [Solirubrobacteraceae bacterium]|nr:IS110 family transposase [Solirubrobacteraceae bacterium]
MQSMTENDRRVIGGVDAHADTDHAAVLDYRGALLGSRSFTVSAAGYRELLAWLEGFGEVDRVGVESTGSYAAGLTRHLIAQGVRVLEVNQPHAHTRRRRGKTDAIDAEMAARHALSLANVVTPKQTTGIVEAIRQLRVARDSAVKSRSVAMLQLGDLILTAPSELREQLATRKTLKAKAALCRRLRPDAGATDNPINAAKFALRSLARRITTLDQEIAELDAQLTPLVASAAPRTTALLGISTGHAGQLLLTAGQNIERLHSERAFAALCGSSPVPVASGKRGRYRLNPGGDRQANRALHMIAVCRLRYCPRTRAYAERRTSEGKTKKEIMRCLKRYIAREAYTCLRDDLRSLSPS